MAGLCSRSELVFLLPVDNTGRMSVHAQLTSVISTERTKPNLRICGGDIARPHFEISDRRKLRTGVGRATVRALGRGFDLSPFELRQSAVCMLGCNLAVYR